MKRRSQSALLALFLLGGAPLAAQLAPPSTGGVARLDRLLQQLGEDRRVLLIGAHPDDEDTRLLAAFAQGRGIRTAYLALTRGEGGQNLLGEELGVPLGLVRSQELESARGIDGAEQFFTRAFDFGYTRSRAEAEALWSSEEILRDVVWIVRTFRPHVVVSVFSGTTRDGHGHHQAAGALALEAFRAAGDPARFPDLPAAPWQPSKLYRATRFDRGSATHEVPIGGIDPRTGFTYNQLAMASRSRHRSQDFGVVQPTGPGATTLGLLESLVAAPVDDDVFAGIPEDTSWLPRLADSLRAGLAPLRMGDAAVPLARALERARREDRDPLSLGLLADAALVAAGIVVDARIDAEELVPGSRHAVEIQLYNGGREAVAVQRAGLEVPAGWTVTGEAPATPVQPGTDVTFELTVQVTADAPTSRPYYLARAMEGARYDWSGVPPEVRGRPFGPAPVRTSVAVEVAGVTVPVTREVTHRYADQAVGEIRRPVRVVPAVEVHLDPERLVWSSVDNAPRTFTVTLRHHGDSLLAGEVHLAIDGWPAPPAAQRFQLAARGETETVTFQIRRPATFTRGGVTVRAVARAEAGRSFGHAIQLVEYPHIRPTQYVVDAVSEVRVAPITLPRVGRIGYVRGAADRVPEALRALGLPVELLDARALAGDLAGYDAIVIGSRAYETDTALVRQNDRLLQYVRAGGHLIVQYQQYQFARGGYAPYRLAIRRPHDRITDETAPVRVLEPEHPVFLHPHRIGTEDWEGWPQERGLYFAGEWDAAYTPLLEMQDPDRDPVRGGLLVAPLGEGTYVYTGVSFFRSLPAGVPGAVRLFLNLLALAER